MQAVKIDRILRIAIGLLLATYVFVIYHSVHENLINVGDTAPDFSIVADNGQTISAGNFGGKVLVLNFWATWCPPCIQELPSLNAFSRRFAGQGVVVLGVSVDKDQKAYRDFLTRAKVSFLTARDPEQNINRDYGTLQFPETYIIDRNGKVVQKVINATNWMDEKMVNYVQSLL
ncbi:MAG: TlpA family protein disulfide reductase [Acidobacteriota bacterium]|nr:TlpA family protein disulfide reductase [Acidobacteriota bacterium]